MLRSVNYWRACHASAVRLLGPVFTQRGASTSPVPAEAPQTRQELEALLKEDLPTPYDGPDRDLVNFPRMQRATHPGKIRMGFLPEEWFQFFYKKTGVTGPYVFGAGLLTFLLSKELYVIEHEFSTGVAIFILTYTAIKKFKVPTRAYFDKLSKGIENDIDLHKEKSMQQLVDAITNERKQQWHASGQSILMDAKRENVHIQLETEYRRRLKNTYDQVKKRLEYQLDVYNTRRKLEQKHMVDWIVNTVERSITPQQEKDALQKCIEDLKVLSAQAH